MINYSLEYFDFVYNELLNLSNSKKTLSELEESFYLGGGVQDSSLTFNSPKRIRKERQYSSMACMISSKFNEAQTILEFGCGNGTLSRLIASKNPEIIVTGVDYNKSLIKKCKEQNLLPNLTFICDDVFNSSTEYDYDLIIGLHTCGSIADKIVQTAKQKSNGLFLIPCCYAKINPEFIKYPQSNELGNRSRELLSISDKIKYLSGSANKPKTLYYTLHNLYCRLIDIDRVAFLRENGFDVSLEKIGFAGDHSFGIFNSALIAFRPNN